MAFEKVIPSKIHSYEIYDVENTDELQKVANIQLPPNFEYDPDFLYIMVRIVSSGQYYGSNNNADYFPTEEIENGYQTFAEANLFQEHRNKDVANAIGKIISFEWNPVMKTVEVLKAIDSKRAPAIVRGYKKGYMTDVSMGCRVPYTVCSVCGNKASKRTEFCDHVKYYRNKYLPNGEKVFEINYKPRFHDSSVVLKGAERSAKAIFILDESDFSDTELFSKTASDNGKKYTFTHLSEGEMDKVASLQNSSSVNHPLFKRDVLEKEAYDRSELLQKLAAIEKSLTGKIIGIAAENGKSQTSVEKLIEIIKFMGDGRFTESTTHVADTLNDLADKNNVPRKVAFKAFVTISELMGIQLYPSELHGIAKEMTFGDNPDFDLTEQSVPLTPKTYVAQSGNRVIDTVKTLPKIEDAANLLTMYELAPLYRDVISDSPAAFIEIVNKTPTDEKMLPAGFADRIKEILKPIIPNRSSHSSNIHARLMSFLGGGKVLKDPSPHASHEIATLTSPRSVGDLLSLLMFTNYQDSRPKIKVSMMSKTASYFDNDLKGSDYGWIGKMYSSPLFEKTAHVQPMDLSDSKSLKTLIKVANEIDSGQFNAFGEGMVEKLANFIGGDYEKAHAATNAFVLELGGEEKLANQLKNEYRLPNEVVDMVSKFAYEYVEEELEKAASDFEELLVAENFTVDKDIVKTASELDVNLKDKLFLKKMEQFFGTSNK